MNAMHPTVSSPDLTATCVLARLLERLERSAEPVGAAQYRAVAMQLAQALQRTPPGPALTALLEHFPATAELYENLHYEHAGLCRAPLERSLNTEMRARDAIEHARHPRTA